MEPLGIQVNRYSKAANFLNLTLATLDVTNVGRYYKKVITSFADKGTELVATGYRVARYAFIESTLRRKLALLEIAGQLSDLRVPPGNHLEKLKGDWAGFHSIRVNDQWRLCFKWTSQGPAEVQLVDYHR
jgi:proteic killer suppression protein